MAIVASHERSVRATAEPAADWQTEMKNAIRDPRELCRRLQLGTELAEAAAGAAGDFPLFAPLGYVAKMEVGNPRDPLLRQVLPVSDELQSPDGFARDPVGDLARAPQPGLLHKYHGRVLLITTGACAIHCRYCFRRHFPYSQAPKSSAAWQPAIDQIAADPSVSEVILSGGDPLTLVDAQLESLIRAVAAIGHVTRLRIHSRLPIVIPSRVTGRLLELLDGSRLTPVMVVHANHPRELEGDVGAALAKLIDVGIPTLNQAVLLREINDNVETLAELSERLVNLRVMPYYLHQLDRVQGAAHFEVPIESGRRLMDQLRKRLPGYAVPRYVHETPGAASKTVIG